MTTGEGVARGLFDAQLAAIAKRDVDALLAQYHPEAELVRADQVVTGPEALREFFTGYLAMEPAVAGLEWVRTTRDVVLYQATMVIGGRTLRTNGTFVLREGKIWRQTAVAEAVNS